MIWKCLVQETCINIDARLLYKKLAQVSCTRFLTMCHRCQSRPAKFLMQSANI